MAKKNETMGFYVVRNSFEIGGFYETRKDCEAAIDSGEIAKQSGDAFEICEVISKGCVINVVAW